MVKTLTLRATLTIALVFLVTSQDVYESTLERYMRGKIGQEYAVTDNDIGHDVSKRQVGDIDFNITQSWYTTVLDHYIHTDHRTFKLRYWDSDTFDSEKGPVFVYICGEYTCPGIPDTRHYPMYMAQKYGARVFVLEHRYYGLSQPFDNLET